MPTARLFYTKSSRPCIAIVRLLDSNPKTAKSIERIPVHPGQRLPVGVHVVPAIQDGESGSVRMGNEAFDYVQGLCNSEFYTSLVFGIFKTLIIIGILALFLTQIVTVHN
jgi:hypothetical protein